MSHSHVQGLLKNTDLLLDQAEIHAVVCAVVEDKRELEVHVGREKGHYLATLIKIVQGESILMSQLEPQEGNYLLLLPNVKVTLFFLMGGYTLETTLACLKPPGKKGVRLSYPALFRVHSKRQVSRFSTPLDMTSFVEMVGNHGQARGELQDINQEGLSFVGSEVTGEMVVNEEVRLRLLPLGQVESAMELTGVLRFSGLDQGLEGAGARLRYSVQIVSIQDAEAFRLFFSQIKTCSHSLFRASVMSAESYRKIATI